MSLWDALFIRVLLVDISIFILLAIFDPETKNVPFYLFLIAVSLCFIL
jgi:hypothetical protein